MGTKYKEVNTLSFIGNVGPKTERAWKEVDEEEDIIAAHLSSLKKGAASRERSSPCTHTRHSR